MGPKERIFVQPLNGGMEMTKKADLKLVYRGVRHNGEVTKSKPQTKGVYRGSKWVA